jgi:uncharacterized protein YecE (DUF72 family)
VALYVGTSGWAYKEWKPGFYPEGLSQARFLAHYASALTACEINATFYRTQAPATFARWAAETPETFRFAVKAHRGITHGAALAPEPNWVVSFLRSLAPLGTRLGAVLFQLPPYRARDDAGLERLLGALPRTRAFALEFRHDSWRSPAVAERVAAAGGTICLADTEGAPPPALPPGPIAYVRLRAERYAPAERDGWLALLRREAAARDVFAFAKHASGSRSGSPPRCGEARLARHVSRDR